MSLFSFKLDAGYPKRYPRSASKVVSVAVLLLFLLSSCDAMGTAENRPYLCIGTWNVQNLFNAASDGNEYSEYKPSESWTQEAYEKRLSNARTVLRYLPEAQNYIMVLNEIEGPDVVNDLIFSRDLAKSGLCYYACTEEADQAIQIAVISSLPIEDAHVHEVSDGLRPVLEVQIRTGGEKLFVLATHMKSNLEGVSETAASRLETAKVLSQIARNIQKNNPGCLVVIAGDMNEECWDNNCFDSRGPSAEDMGAVAKAGSIAVSGTFMQGRWYCPWMDSALDMWPGGSYWYNGDWKCYDNLFLSQSASDGSGLEFSGAGVLFQGILRTNDNRPNSWNRNLLAGVSDHLPVWALLDLQ